MLKMETRNVAATTPLFMQQKISSNHPCIQTWEQVYVFIANTITHA